MASTTKVSALDPQQEAVFKEKAHEIDAAQGIPSLLKVMLSVICSLLKRKEDAEHLRKTLAATSNYFMATMSSTGTPPGEKLANLKKFSKEIVRIVVVERALIARPPREAVSPEAPHRRVVDLHPEALADREPVRLVALEGLAEIASDGDGPEPAAASGPPGSAPTDVVVPEPPPLQSFDGFADLFPAAVRYRVKRVAAFFQRYNPGLERDLARPFLLSARFADRLGAVVSGIIVPQMMAGGRNIAVLETSQKWAGMDAFRFWEVVDGNERLRRGIHAAWTAAWDGCRQRRVVREERGVRKSVLTASPLLRQIRDGLAPEAGEYLLPAIRNAEIDLFASMLYDFDLDRLDYTWRRLRQLYEQELDRRSYQDKARAGAFRDSILSAFEMVPDQCGDFLAMLCYFCFPNIDLVFLERFTHNKGSTPEERRKRIPYLMHFLDSPGVDQARRREAQRRSEREQAAGTGRSGPRSAA